MAKEKIVKEEGKSKLQTALDKLNKDYGVGTVLSLNDKVSTNYDVISSGSVGMDWITLGVGGFVKGKLYELMGWESCLSGDTFVLYKTIGKDGKYNSKGGSLKSLYEKFNDLPLTTKFKKKRKDITECSFTVPSINEDGFIIHSKIKDVLHVGIKPVYEIKTAMGYSIKATDNHKFYIGHDWKELKDLTIGDEVFIHNNTTFKKENQKRLNYKEISVKYHPKWSRKLVEGKYEFFRSRRSRATIEANLNNMNYLDYIKYLNTAPRKDIDNLIFIPDNFDVHHINENTFDDRLENLELISNVEHGRHHSLKNQNNLRFISIPDSIVSIEFIEEQDVYDIICEDPYRNFIANNFVVHNCGKSTICGHAAAECQKKGGVVLYIDGEHAVDKNYFELLGVNIDKLLISQPDNGEQGFNTAMELVKTGEIDLVIIDSDSSLIPKKVIDGDVGDSSIGRKAWLNSNAYPKLKSAISENKVCCIVVSQYREKIGILFGNPTTTQGGHSLKFYSDCRIEVAKSQIKDGDTVVANLTKVKSIKNKMCPPFRKSEFNIKYGVGIDKITEIIDLASELEIIKKWGKSVTFNEEKYDVVVFTTMLEDNEIFFNELKEAVINKIKNIEIKIEEDVTSED